MAIPLGLLLWRADGLARAVLEAILDDPALRAGWLPLVAPPDAAGLARVRRQGARAFIGDFETIAPGDLPAVGVTYASRGAARVIGDDAAMGQAAARLLLAEGRRSALALSWHDEGHLLRRCEAFRDTFRAGGGDCQVLVLRAWDGVLRHCHRQRPAALFCCNDSLAQGFLERRGTLAVPLDLAVVGADGVDLASRLADPALTTVPFDVPAIAAQAVAEVRRLLAGGRPRSLPVLVPPAPVRRRATTGSVAWAPLAALRAAVTPPPSVAAWAASCRLQPLALSRACQAATGRSAKDLLDHERLDRATTLLRTTRLPQAVIAQRCGIGSATRLGLLMRRLRGCTPGSLRD